MKRITTETDLRELCKKEILDFLEENPGIHTYLRISEETGFSLTEVEDLMKELAEEGNVQLGDDVEDED